MIFQAWTTQIVTGIDIGHHSIKAITIKKKCNQLICIHFCEFPVMENIFFDGHVLDLDKVKPYFLLIKKSLSRLFSSKSLWPQFPFSYFFPKVAFSIIDSHVICHDIALGKECNEKDVSFMIEAECEQLFSFSIEDFYIDYFLSLRSGINNSESVYKVFATKKKQINHYQSLFKSVGLKPYIATIHSYALGSIWEQIVKIEPTKKSWMLVDIGHEQTTFFAIDSGGLVFSKVLLFGWRLCCKKQPLSAEYLNFILLLSKHINQQIQCYQSDHKNLIGGVWLTGGRVVDDDGVEQLSNHLSLPITALNTYAIFSHLNTITFENEYPLNQYTVALGLALQALNTKYE